MTKTALLFGLLLVLGACVSTPEPPLLQLPTDPYRVRVESRGAEEVPSLGVKFQLGEVGPEGVVLEVLGIDGTKVLSERVMKLDDSARLVLGKQEFNMTVVQLYTAPGEQDFVVLELSPALVRPTMTP